MPLFRIGFEEHYINTIKFKVMRKKKERRLGYMSQCLLLGTTYLFVFLNT